MGYTTHFFVVLADSANDAREIAKDHCTENNKFSCETRKAWNLASPEGLEEATKRIEEELRARYEFFGKQGRDIVKRLAAGEVLDYTDCDNLEMFARALKNGVLNEAGEFVYKFLTDKGEVCECFENEIEWGVTVVDNCMGDDILASQDVRTFSDGKNTMWVVECDIKEPYL